MWAIQRPAQRAPHERKEGGQALTLACPGKPAPERSAVSSEHARDWNQTVGTSGTSDLTSPSLDFPICAMRRKSRYLTK